MLALEAGIAGYPGGGTEDLCSSGLGVARIDASYQGRSADYI